MMRRGAALALLAACALLSACAARPSADEGIAIEPIGFSQIDGWHQDDVSAALGVFLRSCDAIDRQSPAKNIGGGPLQRSVSVWQNSCLHARNTPPGDDIAARRFFEDWFEPYRVTNKAGDSSGLITGYYEPQLRGSLVRKPPYTVPLYAPPRDMSAGVSYFTREQIERGALRGKKAELVWVDDPIAAFFLHIQGSGQVVLDDGSVMRVGFAADNRRDYVPIGKLLVEDGEIEQRAVSMQSIRDWLRAHPSRAAQYMNRNPSYVFFRQLQGVESPLGAQGVELTPERSLAIDKRYYPYGAPVFVSSRLPDLPAMDGTAAQPALPLRRLMIAQDTGGAIKGAVRGDVFFGPGPRAEALAGYLKSAAEFAVLLPKNGKDGHEGPRVR